MKLFDILKARAGIPADDPLAVMFARRSNKVEHYGMKWAKTNPDPRGRCEYLYDCADWTPMQCQSDGTVSRGSWTDDSAFFLRHLYPVMCKSDGTEDYRLSKSDHAYKEDGVTASDVSNTSYNGNAMACFDCHIWIKFFEDDDNQGFEIANCQLDQDFADWAYIRADGSHANKLYYPMFEGTLVSGKLRSIASGKAQSGTTASEELQYAQANDGLGSASVWSMGDWSHHLLFACLCMLVGKTTCPEMALGEGNTNGGTDANGFATNGALLDKGAFWGKPRSDTASENNQPVKTFFCENMWANRWKRTLGFYNGRGIYYVKTSPPYTVDETVSGYTNCGELPENGWLKGLKITPCGLLPASVGASATTFYGAYFYKSNNYNQKMLLTGGTCKAGSDAGIWYLLLEDTPDVRYWNEGASLYLMQPHTA